MAKYDNLPVFKASYDLLKLKKENEMKRIESLLLVLLALLGMSSCSNELGDAGGVNSSFEVEVPLSLRSGSASAIVSGSTGALSRSTDPSLVNDTLLHNAWILQFIDGNFEKSIYKDSGLDKTFPVKLTNNESGVLSHVYVVANAGATAFATAPASETAFLAGSLNIPTEAGLQLTAGSLPMLGSFELEVSDKVLPQIVDLQRLVARVSLKWSMDPALNSHLVLTSARLCNVPEELYFTAPTDGSTFPATPTLYNGDATDLTVAGTPDSLVYYLPDNRRGTGTNAGGDAIGKSGVENATYIELTGFYNGDRVEYHLYPGADDINDYNVVRNTDYRMNLTLTGLSTDDKRVAARTATANSYLVPMAPGSAVYIPVKRANQSTELGRQLPDLGNGWSSEVIWRDNSSLEIETDDADKAYGIFKVKVNSDGQSGNALVCIKDGSGNILWSWHIWVTDFDPLTSGETYNDYTFMDRNLGAINDTEGDAGALGLLYQWGRKDPFAGASAKASGTTTLKPLYSGGSGPGTYTSTNTAAPTTSPDNLETAVRHPGVFYTSGVAPKDWYIGGSDTQNNALWGSTKTVYDPCPAGWKVAPKAAFSSWDPSTATSTWDTNGRIYAPVPGSWYPTAGYRNSASGALDRVGTNGYYWSSAFIGTSSTLLSFDQGNVVPAGDDSRSCGFSVRCVLEN